MKALTICQPYAELICRGLKRVENRTWGTRYTGPLAIHAGKSRKWLETYSWTELPPSMPFGAVVAVAMLVACVEAEDVSRWLNENARWKDFGWVIEHEHATGPWLWILGDVRRLAEPIPYGGKQGLWEWAPDRPLEFASRGREVTK